jgi:5-oxopent-3-ene-1,2,5-tricarboxylate decarboxylase/2-hydroxyhepta-2,4-diene-1,7-dioate isomerase
MAGVGAVCGSVYGVALNDADEHARLSASFARAPYRSAPVATVLYLKPRNTLVDSPAEVPYPEGAAALEANLTVALLFARRARRVALARALDCVGACALAIDVSIPTSDYFRPAVRERARDRFLPLGAFGSIPGDLEGLVLETYIDGRVAHRRSFAALRRMPAQVIAEVSDYMSFEAGDVLLVGLAGDAPRVRPGARIEGRAAGLAPIRARIVTELP